MTKHGLSALKTLKILLNHIFIVIMEAKFGLMQRKFGFKSKTYKDFAKIPVDVFSHHNDLHATLSDLKEVINSSERFFNEGTSFVIFMDSIEQLSSNEHDLLDWIILDMPKHFKIIYSTNDERVYDKLRQKLGEKLFFKLGRLTADSSLNLLNKMLNKSNRKLNPQQTQNVKKFLANNSNECRPLYLKILHDIARKWRSYTPHDANFDKCTSIGSLVKYLFNTRLEYGYYSTLVFYLNQFNAGITDSELECILKSDSEYPASKLGSWIRLKYELKDYFMPRNENGMLVFSWLNQQMTVITRQQLYTYDNESFNKKIQNITHYFLTTNTSKLYAIDSNASNASNALKFNVRKLTQLPYIIVKLNDASLKRELLSRCVYFDYEFVYAKALLDDDFEFLDAVKDSLVELKCVELLLMHVFYESYSKYLIKNPVSLLEQARLRVFDMALDPNILKFLSQTYSDDSLRVVAHTSRKQLTLEPRSALVPFHSFAPLNLNQLRFGREYVPCDLVELSEELKEFVWFYFNGGTRRIIQRRMLTAYDVVFKQEVNLKNVLLFNRQNEAAINNKKLLELEELYQETSVRRENLAKFIKFVEISLPLLMDPKMNAIVTCAHHSLLLIIENIFNVEADSSKILVYDYKNNVEIKRENSLYCFYLNTLVFKCDTFISSTFDLSNFLLLTMNLFDVNPATKPFTCLNLVDLEGNLQRKFELNEMFRDYLVLPFNYLLTVYRAYFEVFNLTNGEIIKGNINKPIVAFCSNIDKSHVILSHSTATRVYLVFLLEDYSIQVFEILFPKKKLTIRFKYEKIALSYMSKERDKIKCFEMRADRRTLLNAFENDNDNEMCGNDYVFKFGLTVNFKLYVFEVENTAFSFRLYDLSGYGAKNKETEVKLVDFYKNLIIVRVEAKSFCFCLGSLNEINSFWLFVKRIPP